jgi:hypothetical protein
MNCSTYNMRRSYGKCRTCFSCSWILFPACSYILARKKKLANGRLLGFAHLALLSPTEWKEEAEIYEKILSLHPMLTLNEHDQILKLLHSQNEVERLVTPPHGIQEIESPNRFGRVYIDHIEPFCTIVSVNYKLVHRPGGRRNKNRLLNMVPPLLRT